MWKKHSLMPSVYYNLPVSEQTVLAAFFEKEIEEKNQIIEALSESDFGGLIIPIIQAL